MPDEVFVADGVLLVFGVMAVGGEVYREAGGGLGREEFVDLGLVNGHIHKGWLMDSDCNWGAMLLQGAGEGQNGAAELAEALACGHIAPVLGVLLGFARMFGMGAGEIRFLADVRFRTGQR